MATKPDLNIINWIRSVKNGSLVDHIRAEGDIRGREREEEEREYTIK